MRVAAWALRGGVAVVFLIFGSEKVFGSSWVSLFDQIGFGQWFRYFTGSLQLLGGVLMLVPYTTKLGAGVLACTMLGAILIHMFVLGTGVTAAIVPAALLGLIGFAGLKPPGGSAPDEASMHLR